MRNALRTDYAAHAALVATARPATPAAPAIAWAPDLRTDAQRAADTLAIRGVLLTAAARNFAVTLADARATLDAARAAL